MANQGIHLLASEALFLLWPSKSHGKDLIHVTLKELVMLEVLAIERRKVKIPNSPSGFTINYIIHRGSQFNDYKAPKIHAPFLEPFKQRSLKIPLPFYAHKLILSLRDQFSYFKDHYVYKEMVDKGLLKSSWFHKISVYKLTESGKALQAKLSEMIDLAERDWDLWAQREPLTFIELTNKLGTAVLIIEDLNFKILGKERSNIAEAYLDYFKETPEQKLPKTWFQLRDFERFNLFSMLTSKAFSFAAFEDPFSGNLDIGLESEFDEIDFLKEKKPK